jgi:hypothetical protein
MNPEDQATERIKQTLNIVAGVVGILTIVGLIVLAIYLDNPEEKEVEITVVGEYDDISFQELVSLIQNSRKGRRTSLQIQALASRWVGKRVLWEGFVWDADGETLGQEPVIILLPQPVRVDDGGRRRIGDYWAQAYFPPEYREYLWDVNQDQNIVVDCQFDKLLGGDTPILKDCQLAQKADPSISIIPPPEEKAEPKQENRPGQGQNQWQHLAPTGEEKEA